VGNTVGSLTQEQKSVVIGSLLGDGYLRMFSGRKDAILEINHSIREKDYVDWKAKILGDLVKTLPKARKCNGGRIAYRFSTRSHPELTKLYRQFYTSGRKEVPEIEIDRIALSIWFMDDGSKERTGYYLNSQRFSAESQSKLLARLRAYGISASLNRDKQYWRIRITKEGAKKFREVVEPYIHPRMRYKLG
jgi:hypothetical protein